MNFIFIVIQESSPALMDYFLKFRIHNAGVDGSSPSIATNFLMNYNHLLLLDPRRLSS